MNHARMTAKTFIFNILLLTVVSLPTVLNAQDGKALFQSNCASCHGINKALVGPALMGVEERVTDKKLLHSWIRNNQAVLASGNKYFNDLFAQYNKAPMNMFPNFSDAEIDAILSYIGTETIKLNSTPVPTPGGGDEGKGQESDNSLMYGILTLILAVIALVLLQVNSNLKKLADDREGVPSGEPIPFYRNKAYIAMMAVVLFVIGGYYVIQGAIGLGRQKDYHPVQPIFYSHKVHAGTNQINCLYCHGGAQEGKHANIPTLNVCVNCHMAITEYGGAKL